MDLIEDGVNGYLVEVGDTQGLAERLVDVLDLPEPSWQQMSEAAYKTAEKFTWEDATVLFEKTLDLAIKRFGKTSAELSVSIDANSPGM